MEASKQHCAIAVAGLTLGGMLHEAGGHTEGPGTLIRIIEHPESHSATEICLMLDEGKLTEILLRDHDQHARGEHFTGMIEATLRLADCVMHGAGALRRETL